jgi:hypothetical protein
MTLIEALATINRTIHDYGDVMTEKVRKNFIEVLLSHVDDDELFQFASKNPSKFPALTWIWTEKNKHKK